MHEGIVVGFQAICRNYQITATYGAVRCFLHSVAPGALNRHRHICWPKLILLLVPLLLSSILV